MYTDYSFCQAVKYWTSKGYPGWMVHLVYDVGCSWFINFFKRVAENSTLSWDDRMKVIVSVGKWHLSAHVDSCFCQFSLNFVTGAGLIDGEVMETIWSQLNAMAIMARAMTAGHRRAVINRQLGDMNFKKMISMGMMSLSIQLLS
jgi:hypothetical protein